MRVPHIGFALWLATVLFGIGAIVMSGKTLHAKAEPPEAASP